jgi:quercetin dioxygenase-like cupin family protein
MVEVNRLDGLVEYQVGLVVSRTVIDKDSGKVTLFAFDEGEGLSEHTAPYDALVYVFEGRIGITIS